MSAGLALARLRAGDAEGALTLLDAPHNAAAHAARGMSLLALGRPTEARAALRAATALGDTGPSTMLNLALAEDAAGDPARARLLIEEQERLAPDWDEPPLRLAQLLRHRDPAAAEAAFMRALACNPTRQEALLGLGAMLVTWSRGPDAIAPLRRAVSLDGGSAEAWHTLGLALRQAGEPGAEAALVRACQAAPDRLDIALDRLDAAAEAGTLAQAASALAAACEAAPLDGIAQAALGAALARLGQGTGAIDALETATVLLPDHAGCAALLGTTLAGMNQLVAAEAALRRAVALDPLSRQFRLDLAATLMRRQGHSEARVLLDALQAEVGDDPGLLCAQAAALVYLGEQEAATRAARKAIALAPTAPEPRRALLNVLPYHPEATGRSLLAAARACGDSLPAGPAIMPSHGSVGRKLRVGLLGTALRVHPVGWLTLPGWENLGPGFELVALGPRNNDAMSRRFAALTSAWHATTHLDDAGLAALGRSLALDILVDLGGYGEGGRMGACALRLAPVQIKWVGMQSHSTGLPAMDWFLTDRWETPAGFEPLYSERLLRLPDGYVCYTPPAYAPDVTPLPALSRGHVTFGCFNNLAKITPLVIAAWARVLHGTPGSRLMLLTHQFGVAETRDALQAAFAVHGIPAERLVLRGGCPHRDLLGAYSDVDIVLDPFPYGGGLTTCEALWMGVPSVTLPGESFASRHTFSHQSNAGLTGWDAPDPDGYVALAIARAADLPALARQRAMLRDQIQHSPLCDGPRFGRNLGHALREAWKETVPH